MSLPCVTTSTAPVKRLGWPISAIGLKGRSLVSAARAASASCGSSVARAVLRADLQYQIPGEDKRPAASVAPVAQCQRPAASTAPAAPSVGRPKRPAPPAVSSRPNKAARKSSARSSAAAASARPPAGDNHGKCWLVFTQPARPLIALLLTEVKSPLTDTKRPAASTANVDVVDLSQDPSSDAASPALAGRSRGQRTTRDELMALQSGSTSWDALWPQEEPTMRSWPLGADQSAADTFRLLAWYSGYLPRDLEQNAPNNMATTEALAAGGRLYSAAELGSFDANESWHCLRHPPEPISFDATDPRFKPLHLATLTFYRQHARALWDRTHFFLPAEGPGRSELLAQRRRRNSSMSAALKQHNGFLMDILRDNSSRVFGKFISAPPPVTVGPHLDAPSPSPPRLTPVSPPGSPTSAVLDALRQRWSSGSPDADPNVDAADEPARACGVVMGGGNSA
ncbi:hypothetical protein P43SY_011257 [Pythium insidiosum]|uniref:Uncharacterized protein n=1 Tax=Pythium insidiosum TaxID=114742 RepID=A0AAD5Q1D4_PYTIN|nr:hypothetical protein P43SY_011257 [Pythium insidiosum]